MPVPSDPYLQNLFCSLIATDARLKRAKDERDAIFKIWNEATMPDEVRALYQEESC